MVADSIDKFLVLCEDLEGMYSSIDVKGKVAADIGGYLGETASLFLHKGASFIHTYEPIFYDLARLNVRLNNMEDRISVHPYSIWWKRDKLKVNEEGVRSGLRCGDKEISVIPLDEVLKQVDIVKMDCEGCEYSLLMVASDIIKLVDTYVIEVHGAELPIVEKMKECGYSCELMSRLANFPSLFTKEKR